MGGDGTSEIKWVCDRILTEKKTMVSETGIYQSNNTQAYISSLGYQKISIYIYIHFLGNIPSFKKNKQVWIFSDEASTPLHGAG